MVISNPDNISQQELRHFVNEAKEGEKFDIEINYNILKQVSSQLYNNPRRAIEELVCNSYDAAATKCYLSTPKDNQDCLQVLDNGVSMDEEGLQNLWEVAGGTKNQKAERGEERTISKGEVVSRRQIGRFGVGKLAAYALGNELIHVATKNGTTRIISVSKDNIRGKSSGNPPKAQIYEMGEEEAKEYLGSYLNDIPDPWDKDWESWTLAIVDDIDADAAGDSLKPQYLNKMIRTSIPRGSKFTVFKNKDQINSPNFPEEEYSRIENLAENDQAIERLKNDLLDFWTAQERFENKDEVPEELYQVETDTIEPYENEGEQKAVIVPKLGPVIAEAVIFEEMIRNRKLNDRNLHDHGFKVKVRGKMLNRGDPKFGTPDKTFQWWHRFRGEFEIPELDENILVQRDTVKEGLKPKLARKVMQSVYNELSSRARDSKEDQEYDPGEFSKRFSKRAPNRSTQALQGLAQHKDEEYPEDGWNNIQMNFSDRSAEHRAVDFEGDAITVNKQHPFFQNLKGEGAGESVVQAVGEGLTGNLLGAGYLSFKETPDHIVEEILELSDNTLRAAADYLEDPVKHIKEDLKEKSHVGDTPFEEAVVEALRYTGIRTDHLGNSGDSDLIITFDRAGEEPYKVSVEVKGKGEGKVDHQQAKKATIVEHRKHDDCDHAVLIAREFQTNGQGDDESKLIRQFEESDKLSLLSLEGLYDVLDKHAEKGVDHGTLKSVLTNQKHPSEHDNIVEDSWENTPVTENKTEVILKAAWDICVDENSSKPSILMIRERLRGEHDIEEDDIRAVMRMAQSSTHLVTYDEDTDKYQLMQTADEVLDKLV